MKKRILTLLLMFAMVLTMVPTVALADDETGSNSAGTENTASGSQFVDVQDSSQYYYAPVLWAVESGITKGITETTFVPSGTCTRGQVVTFLYRAAGSPSVSGNNPFTDVKPNDYFYNAVLWAVKNKITNGITDTTFEPNTTCTRGQVVTFLYRASGNPAVDANNPFTDVKSGDYFYNAVLWAVKNEITNGKTDTTFAPSEGCTRGQVVTFLYRSECSAEVYYEKNSTVLDITDVAASDDVMNETEVDSFLDDRDFSDYAITYEYSLSGEYEEETSVTESSTEKHPMYQTVYIAESGDQWVLYVIDGDIFANPVSFNMQSDLGVQLLISETETLTSYDDATNQFFTTIPNDSAVIVETVDKIDSKTLDQLTVEEICKMSGATYTADEEVSTSEENSNMNAVLDEDVSVSYDTTMSAELTEESDDDPLIVVSMGDSYSSGEGNEPFYGQSKAQSEKINDYDWLAHRSEKAWGTQLCIPGITGTMADYRVANGETSNASVQWYFVASSGAETKDIAGEQEKKYAYTVSPTPINADLGTDSARYPAFEKKSTVVSGSINLPAQLSVFDNIQGQVDYVTLTIGGNDVDFAGVITQCVTESPFLHRVSSATLWALVATGALNPLFLKSYKTDLAQKLDKLWKNIDTTMSKIEKVYKNIAEKAGPQAAIIVAGYPQLLDKDGKGASICKEEATLVNEKISAFNDKIEASINKLYATGMNIYFVDVEKEFAEHQMDSSDEWINDIMIGAQDQDLDSGAVASAYSAHPNAKGQAAYAKLVNAKIDEIVNGFIYNGHRYKVYNDAATWDEAKQKCEQLGGHLATITSSGEQTFIKDLISAGTKNSYWLGGKVSSGKITWVTGESCSYTNWHSGEPNNFTGSEDSLMIYRKNNPNYSCNQSCLGFWNDAQENGICKNETFFGAANFGYICEWESEELQS